MAKEKKTLTVAQLKERANQLLAAPTNERITKDFKAGIASMLEWSLMRANAYKGYRYLDNQNSEFDTLGYWERQYY